MSVPQPHIEWIGTNGYNVSPGAIPALCVVNHIMEGSMQSCINWFQNPGSGASSNYGVGLDGRIVCFVDPTAARPWWAWANGVVQHPDATVQALIARANAAYGHCSPNVWSVSVEHEGHTGQPVPDAQLEATAHLAAWLCQRFGVAADRSGLLGHYQFDSVDRPQCPGWNGLVWDQYVTLVQRWLYPPVEPVDPAEELRGYAAHATERLHRAKADVDMALESLQFPPPIVPLEEIEAYMNDARRRAEMAQEELAFAIQSLTW